MSKKEQLAEDIRVSLSDLERVPTLFPDDIDVTEEDIRVRDEILAEVAKITGHIENLCSKFGCMASSDKFFKTKKV